MKIDWQSQADAGSIGESASVLTRPRRSGPGLESAIVEAATAPASEQERIERLRAALARARPAIPESEQAGIKDQVLAGARSGLAKIDQGEALKNFTLGEHVGLEAVILTNGERPSLLVRDGFVDLAAPDIGDWKIDIARFQNQIRQVIGSVGRIDVTAGPGFVGTCFAVAAGLVLTNRHVLEEIAKEEPAGVWTLKWPDETTVDFVAEDDATAATSFKVTGIAFAGADPINRAVDFAHLDMAILRVDTASDAASAFPKPVTLESDVAEPQADHNLYVVGFPGEPKVWSFGGRPPVGHETSHVISTLFNSKFGTKRLAPGTIRIGAGQVAGDAKKWICAHDASTLGGNSGSCVVDLDTDGLRVIALHFAGINREQNWAHVGARLREHIARLV